MSHYVLKTPPGYMTITENIRLSTTDVSLVLSYLAVTPLKRATKMEIGKGWIYNAKVSTIIHIYLYYF